MSKKAERIRRRLFLISENACRNAMRELDRLSGTVGRALDKIAEIGPTDNENAESAPVWTDADDYPDDDCDLVALVDGKMVLGVYVMGSFMTRRGETIAPSHYFIIPAEGDV
jgi:hypothetical protein